MPWNLRILSHSVLFFCTASRIVAWAYDVLDKYLVFVDQLIISLVLRTVQVFRWVLSYNCSMKGTVWRVGWLTKCHFHSCLEPCSHCSLSSFLLWFLTFKSLALVFSSPCSLFGLLPPMVISPAAKHLICIRIFGGLGRSEGEEKRES